MQSCPELELSRTLSELSDSLPTGRSLDCVLGRSAGCKCLLFYTFVSRLR